MVDLQLKSKSQASRVLKKAVTVMGLIFCAGATAQAENNADGPFAIFGIGAMGCVEMLDHLTNPADSPMKSIFVSWAAGYLSGINTEALLEDKSVDLRAFSVNVITQLTIDHCMKNPGAPAYLGIHHKFIELRY